MSGGVRGRRANALLLLDFSQSQTDKNRTHKKTTNFCSLFLLIIGTKEQNRAFFIIKYRV